jgi:GT2 family glycosyltransferase
VIVIAKERGECAGIEEALARQTYREFEIVTEIGGTIPEAWNRAVSRARGQFLVFTETDARPLHDDWLQQLLDAMTDDTAMVKGLEINETPWNLCNTIVRREALVGIAFDESFLCAEDTELFSRLQNLGYQLEKRPVAPVMHSFDPSTPKAMSRAFRYGVNWMRIRHRYRHPVEPVPFSWLFRRLMIAVLQIIGMLAGWFLVFSEKKFRRSQPVNGERTHSDFPTKTPR